MSINNRARRPPAGLADPRITADTVRLLMPKYYGMVKCLDDNIGRILETLRKSKQIDDTIIVFTSDHGDLAVNMVDSTRVPYEGSARIPFLMVCRAKYPPARLSTRR